ncbi:MAG TPA: fibronectin type III domain-containing protein [Ignavibacteria bacterium]|nr:fibronectin type III domain-containing protein [Ignavibacteria bacterium]
MRFRYIYFIKYSLLIFLLHPCFGRAQTSEDFAVELSAKVQEIPPKITLSWKNITFGSPVYYIYKKAKTATSWGEVLGSLPAGSTDYVDSDVQKGFAYEYKIEARGSSFISTGFIYSGIDLSAVHNRDSCSAEINTLMNDLSGDGWQIIRHNIPGKMTDKDVKAIILNDYHKNDNVKAIFILGHIAVPYSGNIAPDGHKDLGGAWPADLFYACMDSEWTDSIVNNSNSPYAANRNIPGDGKWDQSWIPSPSQIQIGRVDLFDMPSFSSGEIQLMKNYLRKAHLYKMDSLFVNRKGLIYDGFGNGFGIRGKEAFPANGWRNFPPLVSKDSITVVGYYHTIPAMANNSYQWVYGCGGGTFTSCNHIGSTSDLAKNPNNSIFTMFFGSGFGDWNTTDNFMRGMLCSNPPALTSCWAARPNWFFHHMALGENIGYSALISQNNYPPLYNNDVNDKPLYNTEVVVGNGGVHAALMGDPSLRSDYIKPPSNLEVNDSKENSAELNWVNSPDPDVIGYYVYRSDSLYGFYEKLTDDMLTANSYTDNKVKSGLNYYMVRPVKLQSTPSGKYYNLGIGITGSIYSNVKVNNVLQNFSYSNSHFYIMQRIFVKLFN